MALLSAPDWSFFSSHCYTANLENFHASMGVRLELISRDFPNGCGNINSSLPSINGFKDYPMSLKSCWGLRSRAKFFDQVLRNRTTARSWLSLTTSASDGGLKVATSPTSQALDSYGNISTMVLTRYSFCRRNSNTSNWRRPTAATKNSKPSKLRKI